jgi:DNA-binding YbaB/EbfC family protein
VAVPGDIDGQLDALLEQARAQAARIGEVQRQVVASTSVGQAANGMITVKVRGNGKVTEVNIDPEAMRYYDAKTLGAAIVEAINDAILRSVMNARDKYTAVMPDTDVFDTVLTEWKAVDDSPAPVERRDDFLSW